MFMQYFYRSIFSWIGTAIFIFCILAVINQAFYGGRSPARKISAKVEQQQERKMELEQAREEANKANLDAALVALQEAKLSYESAVVQAQQWETEILPLKENDTGKLVGFDENMVDHMAYLFNQERPSSEELQESLERVNEQLAAISVADGVSQSQLDSFQELRRNAVISRRDWEQAVQSAQAIVRQSRRSVVGPGSESTVEGHGESADLGEQMEQAHDQQLLIELEARRQADQQLWQAEIEAEAERIRQEAERTEAKRILIEEAHSPEVQGVLHIFLLPRYLQPKLAGGAMGFRPAAELQPMSLSIIESTGALQPGIDGLRMLAKIGTDRDLPQPRWGFGSQPNSWTAENLELLNQAQALLIRLGPTLVNEGLLSP